MIRNDKKLKIVLWCAAALAGLLQAWAERFYIEPDGVNYLDIAYAYLRHDWHNAINAYWSPLYSWLLALVFGVLHAPLYWESTLLHLLNFVFYLLALACFAFFFDELTELRRAWLETREESASWLIFGYALFTYAALELIRLQTDTPDMFVFALFFLATGILIRIRRLGPEWSLYAKLGAVLAIAYFAKAVMFPLAFVFLGCSLFAARDWKRASLRVVLAAFVFLALAGPWVTLLSKAKGQLTYGEVGKLAYADYVNGLENLLHWHGEIPGIGTPIHGTRALNRMPPVDEFATPVIGTYPPWYDKTYWDDGIQPHFDLRGQLRALAVSAGDYFRLLSAEKGLLVGLLALTFLMGSARGFIRMLVASWIVWLPALAALATYGLVHVETRYIGGAIAVLWCVLFSAVSLPQSETNDRLWKSVTLAAALVLGISIAGSLAGDLAAMLRRPAHVEWEAAMDLTQRGLQPGDTVAVLGKTSMADYWAHLAQVRIVADMPKDALPDYWDASDDVRSRILRLFAQTGAKFLVTHTPPPASKMEGWSSLGTTGYYALPLSPLRFSQ
jgi:hypothetical protein